MGSDSGSGGGLWGYRVWVTVEIVFGSQWRLVLGMGHCGDCV